MNDWDSNLLCDVMEVERKTGVSERNEPAWVPESCMRIEKMRRSWLLAFSCFCVFGTFMHALHIILHTMLQELTLEIETVKE